MKLIVQIPCLDEAESLPATLRRIPRRIDGVDRIETLVVDDGSTDGTAAVARSHGVDHVVRFPAHRGLARAFSAGIDRCLRLGADIIVNLDADSQYDPEEIPRLIEPILRGEAELVIGERDIGAAAHFSPAKKMLQRLGSWVVRRLSGTGVADATSGFRAFGREAALKLNVMSDFTYTLETILQAGTIDLAMTGVAVQSRPVRRRSRLFGSIATYLRKSAATLVRISALYRPARIFMTLAMLFLVPGTVLLGRFLLLYLRDPSYSGHTQSLVIASILFTLGFLLGVSGLVAYLISINRRLLEDLLVRVKRLEMQETASAAGTGLEAAPATDAELSFPLRPGSGGNGHRSRPGSPRAGRP
jgi:glycosyltransferase involved in cell wall biosynthesis